MEAHIRKVTKRARELGHKGNDGKYDWLDDDVELFDWPHWQDGATREAVAWDFVNLTPKTNVYVYQAHPYVDELGDRWCQIVSRYGIGESRAYWWGQECGALPSQGWGAHSVVIPAYIYTYPPVALLPVFSHTEVIEV